MTLHLLLLVTNKSLCLSLKNRCEKIDKLTRHFGEQYKNSRNSIASLCLKPTLISGESKLIKEQLGIM